MAKKHHNQTTTEAPTVKITRHVKGWVAKIGGKVKWLAPIAKPQLAIERYHQKMKAYLDSVHAAPVVTNNSATLGHLGDLFLAAKDAAVRAKEIRPRTFKDYAAGVQRAVDYLGYDSVALNIPVGRWQQYRAHLSAKFAGDPYSLQRNIGAVRSLSKWANLNEYIDRPFRFGTEFNAPSQKAMRAAKRAGGKRTFEAADVRKILDKADPITRALFLLAINGGIGNTDLANMTAANLKLDAAQIEFQRSKTEVPRIIPLWPETVAAVREAQALRPRAKVPAFDDRVFLTETGLPMVRDHIDADGGLTSTTDRIGMQFGKVAKVAGVARTFYDARRTFQTIGDEVGPEHVVRAIMGHAARGEDMGSRYRQSIPIEKMIAVVNHVRARLIVEGSGEVPGAKRRAGEPPKGRRNGRASKPQRRKVGSAK